MTRTWAIVTAFALVTAASAQPDPDAIAAKEYGRLLGEIRKLARKPFIRTPLAIKGLEREVMFAQKTRIARRNCTGHCGRTSPICDWRKRSGANSRRS